MATFTDVEPISVGFDGSATDGPSGPADLSPDGRWVAFVSAATNIAPNDTNAVSDIFLFDRQTRQAERVSVAADGTQANGSSGDLVVGFADSVAEPPAVSSDGRFVAFASEASNLVGGDTNGVPDVFLVDRQADTVTRISTSAVGQVESGASAAPAMTPDGRFIAFASDADNLVAGDTNGLTDIFVYDRLTDEIERISEAAYDLGLDKIDLAKGAPAISADGRFVVFGFGAEQLAGLPPADGSVTSEPPTEPNVEAGVLVHDRQTDTTSFLARSTSYTAETFADPIPTDPAISGDGTSVAFVSGRLDVVFIPPGLQTAQEIHVVDRVTGAPIETVTAVRGTYNYAGRFADLSLSADGGLLAYVEDEGGRVGPSILAVVEDLDDLGRDTTAGGFVTTHARIADEGGDLVFTAFGPDPSLGFTANVFVKTVTDADAAASDLPPIAEGVALADDDYTRLAGIDQGRLIVGEDRDPIITFVDGLAAYDNMLGVYLLDAEDRLIQPKIIFPSTANGSPEGGDSVRLSELYDPSLLRPGQAFGLFLVADGATRNPADLFDPSKGQLEFVEPGGQGVPATTATLAPELRFVETGDRSVTPIECDVFHLVDAGSANPTSNALNPGGRAQVVSGNADAGSVEVRFEDLRLGASDRDFNDLVVRIDTGVHPALPDVVLTDFENDELLVLPGDHLGNVLAPPRSFDTGDADVSVALGDLDEDGFLDAVTTGGFSDTRNASISILLGDGRGGFIGFGEHPVENASLLNSATLGDLNRDGYLDVVATNDLNNRLAIFIGDGTGDFDLLPADIVLGSIPQDVALGDLDGDGNLDFAAANAASDDLSVLLGSSSGVPEAGQRISVGRRPNDLALGDVDGDQALDILVANGDDATVSVLLGDGAGGLVSRTPIATGVGPGEMVLGDVDEDGDLDLLVAILGSQEIGVFLGDGAGAFAATAPVAIDAQQAVPALADMDRDGHLDLVVAARERLFIFGGDGKGAFVNGQSVTLPTSSLVAVGDLHGGDGALTPAGLPNLGALVPLPADPAVSTA